MTTENKFLTKYLTEGFVVVQKGTFAFCGYDSRGVRGRKHVNELSFLRSNVGSREVTENPALAHVFSTKEEAEKRIKKLRAKDLSVLDLTQTARKTLYQFNLYRSSTEINCFDVPAGTARWQSDIFSTLESAIACATLAEAEKIKSLELQLQNAKKDLERLQELKAKQVKSDS